MCIRWAVPIACLLVLTSCSQNHSPLVPALLAPTMAQRGDSIRVRVSSYDKDADSLYFLVEWSDGTESGWVGPVPSTSDYEVFHYTSIPGSLAFSRRQKTRLMNPDGPTLLSSTSANTDPSFRTGRPGPRRSRSEIRLRSSPPPVIHSGAKSPCKSTGAIRSAIGASSSRWTSSTTCGTPLRTPVRCSCGRGPATPSITSRTGPNRSRCW